MRRWTWIALALGTPGCGPTADATGLEPLDAPRLARRMSIDLRGVLPTTAELDQVAADPAALDTLRDTWLADPRFEERLVQLYQEQWYTVLDGFVVTGDDYGITPMENYAFVRSIGEEPLRVVARTIASDQPYSTIVTGDWTMADANLTDIWPVAADAGALTADDGFQPAHYTDGRPAAGVLATNGLWWRYPTALYNDNRLRAAAIFKLLVCTDLLDRPVNLSGSVSIGDADATEAIRTDPTCQSCHASIEPVAATLFGFYPFDDQSAVELEYYHPEREVLGPELLGVAPAWMGQPVAGLADLGLAIAADDRFGACATQTLAAGLLRRDLEDADAGLLADALAAYDVDQHATDAIRSVLASPAYTAGATTPVADAATVAQASTRRLLVTSQLRPLVADLAGLTWTREGYDQLDSDVSGYRVLGGAVDGYDLYAPQRAPGVTSALTLQRVAEVSAHAIAERDLADGAVPGLLVGVTSTARPGDAAFDGALRAAIWRLLARPATDTDVAELGAAFQAVLDAGGTAADGWTCVIAVLLRDPEFVTY